MKGPERLAVTGVVTERGPWRTEPHAHPEYGQVIFVRSGHGVMNLKGASVPFEGPCVLLLPTECGHGLDYEIDVDRWGVTIEVAYLTQVNVKLRSASVPTTWPTFLQSPTKMIHARIVTEARRNLIFGEMSVEQIAFGLGFSDAAYFTRFFRKEVGQAPSQFRATAREQPR